MSELSRLLYTIFIDILEREVKKGPIPRHVGIIMDGNRRYAKKLGLDPKLGHVFGAQKLEEVLKWCLDLGIREVTLYAFSTENFKRSKEEVEHIFNLMKSKLEELEKSDMIHKNKVQVRFIGRLELLPDDLRKTMRKIEDLTKDYDRYRLNVAVAYGGRSEIVDAIKNIVRDAIEGRIHVEDISEALISKYLYTKDSLDPDLIIRTSGEERLSNFLIWQSAYSELYFVDALWPEFTKLDFLLAIRSYQKRERRFGR
ncbi:di-trans,poly-cis-decaprenylcistransferase [Methanosarcinales archaeon]|nr:MAG: di-trans,poly-cis-decaprenylcistransferase [Methanosarcinales archaeon]